MIMMNNTCNNLLMTLLAASWLASTPLAAPAQDTTRPPDQVADLSKLQGPMDIGATQLAPNRRGIFAGVNLATQGIVISGREYPGAAHEIPAVAGEQIKPVYELSANTPVRFHVDSAGIIRAVWVDGELQE